MDEDEKGSRLYDIWTLMKWRCYTKTYTLYHKYGGLDITVCEEWKNDFTTFRNWAFSTGYNRTRSISRLDTNKSYEPNNCAWEENVESNHHVCKDGNTLSKSDIINIRKFGNMNNQIKLSRLFKVKVETISDILAYSSWSRV